MDNIDIRHNEIRDKLYGLGFDQHLPIGALSLVTALLDELVKTVDNLKTSNDKVNQLLEEKTAWDLGVEPFKCDNSKLLAECNSLHLELIKQRDFNEKTILDLKQKLRQSDLDRQIIEEHCDKLQDKIRKIQMQKPSRKADRKPFITAVRSGSEFPTVLESLEKFRKCSHTSSIGFPMNADDNKKLKNELKDKSDLIVMFKKQLEYRDREISRLNKLLIGGRPTSALGKDCCFQGVDNLQTDVDNLQREKLALQVQLERTVIDMHEAMNRAVRLDKRNADLEQELRDMEKVALSVEAEANTKYIEKDQQCTNLEKRLTDALQKSVMLEASQNATKATQSATEMERANLRAALKETTNEKNNLKEKLCILNCKEQDLISENEKLQKKIEKYKNKNEMLEQDLIESKSKEKFNATAAENKEIVRLKSEKDYFENEYHKLLSKPDLTLEVEVLRDKLTQKQNEVDSLKHQYNLRLGAGGDTTRHTRSAVMRIEREKNLLSADLERITAERDELRQRLQLATENQLLGGKASAEEIHHLVEKVDKLETENRRLQSSQVSSKTTIEMLRREVADVRTELSDEQKENSKLRTTYNQLKILQQQTEMALSEFQNRLSFTEQKLSEAEHRLYSSDTHRDDKNSEVNSLRSELVSMKESNRLIETDNSRLRSDMEKQIKIVGQLEAESIKLRTLNLEMEHKLDLLQRKLGLISGDNQQKHDSLRKTSVETDTLRKQMGQLKVLNDNALVENTRLITELSDYTSELHATKKKLKHAEAEVERLKGQLQQYVQEVEKAEELLMLKENEREEMLEQFHRLSHDAVALEDTNHSLEMVATETKRRLLETQAKLADVDESFRSRNKDVKSLEKQIGEMSKQIAKLQGELQTSAERRGALKADVNAVKELCSKLDIEKDKLKDELNELNDIKTKLERDNAKLRSDAKVSKVEDKAAVESLQELLHISRKDADQQQLAANKLTQEVEGLRTRIADLQEKLSESQAQCLKYETLVKEYSIQIQELRKELVDERFAKSKETKDQHSTLYHEEMTKKTGQDIQNPSKTHRSNLSKPEVRIVEEIEQNMEDDSQAMRKMDSEPSLYFSSTSHKSVSSINTIFEDTSQFSHRLMADESKMDPRMQDIIAVEDGETEFDTSFLEPPPPFPFTAASGESVDRKLSIILNLEV